MTPEEIIADESLNPWKRVLIDALVCIHALTEEHETNPKKALDDIVSWEVMVALDPRVSEAARKLVLGGLGSWQIKDRYLWARAEDVEKQREGKEVEMSPIRYEIRPAPKIKNTRHRIVVAIWNWGTESEDFDRATTIATFRHNAFADAQKNAEMFVAALQGKGSE